MCRAGLSGCLKPRKNVCVTTRQTRQMHFCVKVQCSAVGCEKTCLCVLQHVATVSCLTSDFWKPAGPAERHMCSIKLFLIYLSLTCMPFVCSHLKATPFPYALLHATTEHNWSITVLSYSMQTSRTNRTARPSMHLYDAYQHKIEHCHSYACTISLLHPHKTNHHCTS